MRNSKGFTLVELMAVIIILGILLTIAIPNTLSMLERNKKDAYIEDAKKFISLSQYLVEKDKKIEKPKDDTSAVVISLKYLNTSDIENSPYALKYSENLSFVVLTRHLGRYIYYVNLLACDDPDCNGTDTMGLNVISELDLQQDAVREKIRRGDVVIDYISYNALLGKYEAGMHLSNQIGNRAVIAVY